MTVFVAFMLPVLIYLGFWQLDRAQEKARYEDAFIDRMGGLPRQPGAGVPPPFTRLQLRGEFEATHFLVDNRTHQGRAGYWVVTPLRTDDGRRWLVNRGWVPGAGSRAQLPDFHTPSGKVRCTVVVWPDTGMPPLLADDIWSEGWPKRVQRLDVARMTASIDAAVPVEVRIERAETGALVAPPLEMAMSPDKHIGYAVQWFGLAGVLTLGYAVFGLRGAWRGPGADDPSDPDEAEKSHRDEHG